MRIVDAAATEAALDFPSLVGALREMFRAGCDVPVRHHHAVATPDGAEATLLLMPAWQAGRHIGVKVATVFPDNGARGLPAVMASYLLLDGTTGEPLSLIDGPTVTVRRTAAASALAADFLARPEAGRLLMIGTGAMAPQLVRAHASVRPIRDVAIWGRSPVKAEALAARLAAEGLPARATGDLEGALGEADIVSSATLSATPLVAGARLRPGTHVDLVGAYRPDMRESDDETMRRARVWVDTHGGARKEAGDIVQALASGALSEDRIVGDLFELCRGERPGRASPEEITVFKSVGTALEDLAAAQLVHARTAG